MTCDQSNCWDTTYKIVTYYNSARRDQEIDYFTFNSDVLGHWVMSYRTYKTYDFDTIITSWVNINGSGNDTSSITSYTYSKPTDSTTLQHIIPKTKINGVWHELPSTSEYLFNKKNQMIQYDNFSIRNDSIIPQSREIYSYDSIGLKEYYLYGSSGEGFDTIATNMKQFSYDSEGRLVQTLWFLKSGPNWLYWRKTTYSYSLLAPNAVREDLVNLTYGENGTWKVESEIITLYKLTFTGASAGTPALSSTELSYRKDHCEVYDIQGRAIKGSISGSSVDMQIQNIAGKFIKKLILK
jgi:hypothetical protein